MTTTEFFVAALGLIAGCAVVFRVFPTRQSASSRETASGSQSANSSNHEPPRAWHEVLNVSPIATLEEIKAAYKDMIAMYHPDRVANLGIELRVLAEQKAKEINRAYQYATRRR
jgi:DnaJ-class molecular chaperone